MASDEITRHLRRAEFMRQYLADTSREYSTCKNIKCPDSSAHSHGDKNPSARLYENADGTFIKCHGCGGKWDVFSLWMLDNGGTFKDAKAALCEKFGILGHTGIKPISTQRTASETEEREKQEIHDAGIMSYITHCSAAYHGETTEAGRVYMRGRGISDETARRFSIGYDANAIEKYNTFGPLGAIVIPQGTGCALRSIDPTINQKDKVRFYPSKMPRVLFNGEAIKQAAENNVPVFIVEGEIDALSIAECGGIAVSTGGTGGISKAIKAAMETGAGIYIPCMDRDGAGEDAQQKIIFELKKIGGSVFVYENAPIELMPDKTDGTHTKDVNEALQQDAAALKDRIASVVKRATERARTEEAKTRHYFTLADVPEPPSEDTNPRALFRRGYLRKGGGIIAASVAGAGKSTFSIQCALHWVMGLTCFGIEPVRPLKVSIIQAEDDIEELAMFRGSMKKGLSAEGFTPDQIDESLRRLHIRSEFIGKTGEVFAEALRTMQLKDKYDLVIVNPLNSYFDGDISLNRDATEFFRKMIDPIIKDPKTECGIMFIHHMGKPSKGKDAATWGKGAYAQYSIQGAAELNNWARAVLVMIPFENAPDFWTLTAAKRHKPLSWKDAEGKDTKDKVIAYSHDFVYWREPELEEIRATLEGTKPTHESEEERKRREDIELRQAISEIVMWLQNSEPVNISEIYKWCDRNTSPIFKGFHNHTVRKGDGTYYPKKPCYLAYELITKHPEKYGVQTHRGKYKNGKDKFLYGGVYNPQQQAEKPEDEQSIEEIAFQQDIETLYEDDDETGND